MISPSDIVTLAFEIKHQVEAHQANNALSVEIKNRCIAVMSILSKEPKSDLTEDIKSILLSVRQVLLEAKEFVDKFNDSNKFIHFVFAKTYQADFTDIHNKFLRQINDLQLVWVSDVHDRIVGLQELLTNANEVSRTTVEKFEHEAFHIIAGMQDHLDALLNLNHEEQSKLIGNLQGFVAESNAKVLQELSTLKAQKEKEALESSTSAIATPSPFLRSASANLKKAAEAELSEKIDINRIIVNWEKKLGEGTFGQVYSAQYIGEGDVAVKLIPRDAAGKEFFREIAALERVAISREVVHLHGWTELMHPETKKRFVVMVSDLCSSSLAHTIADKSFHPRLTSWLDWLWQVAKGMAFLAAKGVYHRDLKPENVLITFDGHAVISDFGFALTKTMVMRSTSSSSLLSEHQQNIVGTIGFMAPEVLDGQVSEASDVYSFGVLAANALLRTFPWQSGEDDGHILSDEEIRMVFKAQPPSKMPTVEVLPELPVTTISMLNDCCVLEPAFRPHFIELQCELFKARHVLSLANNKGGSLKSGMRINHSSGLGSSTDDNTNDGVDDPELITMINALITDEREDLHTEDEVLLAMDEKEAALETAKAKNKPKHVIRIESDIAELTTLLSQIQAVRAQYAQEKYLKSRIQKICTEFGVTEAFTSVEQVKLKIESIRQEMEELNGKGQRIAARRLGHDLQVLEDVIREIQEEEEEI